MSVPSTKEPLTRTINVRVPESLYQQLDELARATSRTKSFVAVDALSGYLQAQRWQMEEIEAGLAEAERGEFATEAEVQAVFARHGA
jgi:RHH-type rel operon transcriptional repressor/antitoxin RelB